MHKRDFYASTAVHGRISGNDSGIESHCLDLLNRRENPNRNTRTCTRIRVHGGARYYTEF